jgi:ribosomal-protein-alanine N-acetyltransferase
MELNLTTERLLLRPVILSDVDLAIEMFTDPAVMKFVEEPATPDQVVADMPTWIKRGGGGCIGIWCITDRITGEKFGDTYLLPFSAEEDDNDWNLVVPDAMPEAEIEIGYFLKPSAWGKGYATEACRRLLRFTFAETTLDQVIAVVDENHAASWNVLGKCGLTHRGTHRAFGDDSPYFSITREQWVATFKR